MKNFVSGGSRSRMVSVDGRISEVNIKRQTGESAAGEGETRMVWRGASQNLK